MNKAFLWSARYLKLTRLPLAALLNLTQRKINIRKKIQTFTVLRKNLSEKIRHS